MVLRACILEVISFSVMIMKGCSFMSSNLTHSAVVNIMAYKALTVRFFLVPL